MVVFAIWHALCNVLGMRITIKNMNDDKFAGGGSYVKAKTFNEALEMVQAYNDERSPLVVQVLDNSVIETIVIEKGEKVSRQSSRAFKPI